MEIKTFRISRDAILKCRSNDVRKAIAFAIYIKNAKPTSVIKDWSYRKIAELTNLSPNTCKKRIETLRKGGFVYSYVRNGHSYIQFNSLRHKFVMHKKKGVKWTFKTMNADISGIDFTDTKTIEMGLKAMVIVEIQRQKNFFTQFSSRTEHSSSADEYRKLKKTAERKASRSVEECHDDGLSYKTIKNKIGCGFGMVTKIINYGRKNNLFCVHHGEKWATFVGKGMGEVAFYNSPKGTYTFHSRDYCYKVESNSFILLSKVNNTRNINTSNSNLSSIKTFLHY